VFAIFAGLTGGYFRGENLLFLQTLSRYSGGILGSFFLGKMKTKTKGCLAMAYLFRI
jgi:hypothetical protein